MYRNGGVAKYLAAAFGFFTNPKAAIVCSITSGFAVSLAAIATLHQTHTTVTTHPTISVQRYALILIKNRNGSAPSFSNWLLVILEMNRGLSDDVGIVETDLLTLVG